MLWFILEEISKINKKTKILKLCGYMFTYIILYGMIFYLYVKDISTYVSLFKIV